MNVVITGASGLIGRRVVPALACSHDVWAFSRRSNPAAPANVRWVEADLSSGALPSGLPSSADTVIHLAQSQHFRDFPDRALDIFSVNVASTARLLEWSRTCGVKRFIYASSGGVDAGRGYYLASKRAAELLAENYRPFFSVVILRFFFVYGADQRPTMLIPRLVEAVRSGKPIRLDGPDGIRLNPVHASDAAAAVERAAALGTSTRIDVAGPDVLTLRAIAEIIGEKVAREPRFDVQHTAAPLDLVGDACAIKELLGTPTRSFSSGVEELCRAAPTVKSR